MPDGILRSTSCSTPVTPVAPVAPTMPTTPTTPSSNTSNHLLHLLNRDEYREVDDLLGCFDDVCSDDYDFNVTDDSGNGDSINLDRISRNLRSAIETAAYRDPQNILHRLVVQQTERHLILSVPNISDNLKYADPTLNRVLHQSKVIVFDKEYYPLFYIESRLDSSDGLPISHDNSYLDKHLYSVPIDGMRYKEDEFNDKIECYKNHIGAYMVIFYDSAHSDNGGWMFYFNEQIYHLTVENHAVLYEHVGMYLDELDTNLCYHIVLIDSRLRIALQSPTDASYAVLIKANRIHSLEEVTYDQLRTSCPIATDAFVEDNKIYFSCLDQLDLYLEEMNNINNKNKKLYNRGILVKADIDDYDSLHIVYDTYTYKRLCEMLPVGMSIHEAHLHLYQTDRLNSILQYVEDSDNAVLIVTRINLAIVTLGREILDIYHYTRNKAHPELFGALTQAYKDVVAELHEQYLNKKSSIMSKRGDTMRGRMRDGRDGCDVTHNSFSPSQYTATNSRASEHSRIFSDSEKVSITTEDVYITLKNMKTQRLVKLFLDREILRKNLENKEHLERNIANIIKNCSSTSLQVNLLKSH